jgi:hypothetical protein
MRKRREPIGAGDFPPPPSRRSAGDGRCALIEDRLTNFRLGRAVAHRQGAPSDLERRRTDAARERLSRGVLPVPGALCGRGRLATAPLLPLGTRMERRQSFCATTPPSGSAGGRRGVVQLIDVTVRGEHQDRQSRPGPVPAVEGGGSRQGHCAMPSRTAVTAQARCCRPIDAGTVATPRRPMEQA